MSTAVLESKYNLLPFELQKSLELYLDFLLEKMTQKTEVSQKRKRFDFSIFNTNSKNWDNPQTFIAEMRSEERF